MSAISQRQTKRKSQLPSPSVGQPKEGQIPGSLLALGTLFAAAAACLLGAWMYTRKLGPGIMSSAEQDASTGSVNIGRSDTLPTSDSPTAQMGRKEYDLLRRNGPDICVKESVAQVEVVDWAQVRHTLPAGTTISTYLKDRGVALKLVNSGQEQWPAVNWTPSSLLRKMERYLGTAQLQMQESFHPNSLYYNNTEMAQTLEKAGISLALGSWESNTMGMSLIYKVLRQAQEHELDPMRYMYVTGALPPRLAAEVALSDNMEDHAVFDNGDAYDHPQALACRDPDFPSQLCQSELPNVRMWFSSTGMVTSMHYDTSFNAYTVFYGAKHVMVAPPKDLDKAYIYDVVHPSHRQSQIMNMTHPDIVQFPKAAKMKVQETVVRPGETVYIPPYWLQSVQSLSTTIAVSILTESPEGRLAEAACTAPNALGNCPQLFMPLWNALDELKSPKKEEYVIGGCMAFYVRTLLTDIEAHISTALPGERAGSAQWVLDHLEQGFDTGGMTGAGFCEQSAVCVRKMKIVGTPLEPALMSVINEQVSTYQSPIYGLIVSFITMFRLLILFFTVE
jgi:hypothetical protein